MLRLIFLIICIHCSYADYWTDRAKLLQQEKQLELGSKIVLTDKEIQVNKILMNYKLAEFDEGFLDPSKFLASRHFFYSQPKIKNSKVFKLIQQLPKGASLHSHDTALVSFDYLYNLTYSDNLYGCRKGDDLLLHFFKENRINNECDWKLVSELRANSSNFDSFLKSKLTLIVDDPYSTYPDVNVAWNKFMDLFKVSGPLVTYKPIFQEYFYQALKELYEDNVMYLEFRGLLPDVYDLDGNIYRGIQVADLYVETLKQFQKDHPDFYGAKLIYAPIRAVNNDSVDNYIELLGELQAKYPDFIAGFDLVGQEDLGKPLIDFVSKLLEIQNTTKFFFHAGETNWYGETDINLVDAILLNTTRIGHGYAILKHPVLLPLVKEREIGIEINPISNQVLKLVDDLRNHPGSFLIANDFPVVISCDDPTFWGAKALSYDWYVAYMGLTSRESDLRVLKQLAINSILYSTINDKEKALQKWTIQWDEFLDCILEIERSNSNINVISI